MILDAFYSLFSITHILKNKTTWIKIAVETTVNGSELQNAIVRIGYTRRVVLLVSLTPNHLLFNSTISASAPFIPYSQTRI